MLKLSLFKGRHLRQVDTFQSLWSRFICCMLVLQCEYVWEYVSWHSLKMISCVRVTVCLCVGCACWNRRECSSRTGELALQDKLMNGCVTSQFLWLDIYHVYSKEKVRTLEKRELARNVYALLSEAEMNWRVESRKKLACYYGCSCILLFGNDSDSFYVL